MTAGCGRTSISSRWTKGAGIRRCGGTRGSRLAATSNPMSGTGIVVLEADLSQVDHQETTLHLLDAYAQDPMGDGQPLSDLARREVIPGLRQHPTTMIFLAYREGQPVGLAVCFRGFSTFAARP